MNRTYLEICNSILDELFYESVESFDDQEDNVELKKVKRMVNDALYTICNNENISWQFREKEKKLALVPGVSEYKDVNGFIGYIRYVDIPIVLTYCENHKYLPDSKGSMPLQYWMDEGKLNFYPTPDESQKGRLLKVKYRTNDFAKDCCGINKPFMECEDDEPIIPYEHRNILKWRVCADWRANLNDPKSAYYQQKYREAYKSLLDDQRLTSDYPNILDIQGISLTAQDAILDAFYNPYVRRII